MKSKLKVLFLCSWPIGPYGQGSVSFVYEQIDLLSKSVDANFINVNFTSYFKWPYYKLFNKSISPIDNLWSSHKVKSLLYTIPKISTRISKKTLLEEVKEAANIIADDIPKTFGNIDIIHAHVVLPAGLIASIISEKLRIPFILQEHSAPFSMHLNTEEKIRIVEEVLQAADKITAVGNDLKEQLNKRTNKTIQIIPNLVNTTFFKTIPMEIIPGQINLISIGSLEERKGYKNLIKAVGLLNERDKNAIYKLIIVGEGKERTELQSLIDELNLNNSIVLIGQLNREEVRRQLGKSHIYVHSSYKETFGLAPAEALSVGRPVVSTICGGPEYYINKEMGTLVNESDPELLLEGIMSVKNNLDRFDPIVLHSKINSLFGEEVFLKNTLNLYYNLIQNGKE